MYQVDDLIFYGGTGVCRITDISKPGFTGTADEQLYYILKPLYQECVIYTPVNNAKVFMRPIISADEAERLIDMIPSIQALPNHNKALNQLTEYYKDSLKTHDCVNLIKLTMSIYAKKQKVIEQKRKFGVVDERFMRRAEELLFSEFSAALGIPKDKVSEYIGSRVDALKESGKNHDECNS